MLSFLGIAFIDPEESGISSGKDVDQPRALSYAQDYIDIYACAWGPDDQVGSFVGYNLAAEAIANGTKTVSLCWSINPLFSSPIVYNDTTKSIKISLR